MTAKTESLALLLVLIGTAAGAASSPPMQLLPLPAVTVPPAPLPIPPPINPGVAATPPGGISPLLLQPGPAFPLPQQPARPAYPELPLPGPVDQQKLGSYRAWLEGQQRLLERGGGSPDDYLARQIRQQLLQLDQPGGMR